MTWDSYILAYCAMYLMSEGSTHQIQQLKLPWYLHRSYINNWKKYLVTTGDGTSSLEDSDKYLKKYERQLTRLIQWGINTQWIQDFVKKFRWMKWTQHRFGIHNYGLLLWAMMEYTIDHRSKASAQILYLVPKWNLFLLTRMIGHPNLTTFYEGSSEYRPMKGFQRTMDEWLEKDYLPPGQKYYLDKDILDWIVKREL